MPEMSKKIQFYDKVKLENINKETIKLYNKYKVDMSLRDLSKKTVSGYDNDLSHWFIYIYDRQGNQCITELDEDDITEFLYYCKTEGNNTERMKRRMSSISAFYKFLRKKKIITENPMEFIDRPKKGVPIITQTYLTKEQVELMRTKLKSYRENNGFNAEFYQLYALFSLSTMARVNAVANVMWDQIDFENRVCNNILEKEGKYVTLYFNQEVKDLLLEHKTKRETENICDGGYVFYNTVDGKPQPFTNGTLDEWCKKIGAMINVLTLHPHDFRHSAATLYKNSGMSLEDVSALLNHGSTDVTKKFYLKADASKIQANKDKFDI
jgi:site-specific recombinase XerD